MIASRNRWPALEALEILGIASRRANTNANNSRDGRFQSLDRLRDPRLTIKQQATVVDARRTPGKVRWPDWWEI
jgi:hypothetical protein